MTTITASMVAELRGKTDAPMMECKKALTEAEGDMVKGLAKSETACTMARGPSVLMQAPLLEGGYSPMTGRL